MSSAVLPSPAIASIACNRIVDLPTPGSPPSNVTDPGTRPPPSTRSNSAIPVENRFDVLTSTAPSGIGRATESGMSTAACAASRRSAATCTTLPHSPQSPQRPTHFEASAPHCSQPKRTRVRVMVSQYTRATTSESIRIAANWPNPTKGASEAHNLGSLA